MSDLKIVDNGIQVSKILQVKDLNSPMPLFRAKKEIGKLASGQIIRIDGNPHYGKDFNKWCARSGNKYLGEKDMHYYISFFIQKG